MIAAIFIHGGSYNTGAGSMYSGADLVKYYEGKAIIVSINYRLNVRNLIDKVGKLLPGC